MTNCSDKTNKAIFLDRDGVINGLVWRDSGWYSPRKLSEFKLNDQIVELVQALREQEFQLFIVTNQPDITRGLLTTEILKQMHEIIEIELGTFTFLVCPHTAEMACKCRKPKSKMITDSISKFNLDSSKCWIIGDQITDVLAGQGAGIRSILVSSDATNQSFPQFKETLNSIEYHNSDSLKDCLSIIQSNGGI